MPTKAHMIWLKRPFNALANPPSKRDATKATSRPQLGLRSQSLETDALEADPAHWEEIVPLRRTLSLPPVHATPQETALVSTMLLDAKITNLEEDLRTAMGPWAMYGLRYATLAGLASATVVKIALAIVPLTIPVVPLVGLGIFLGLVVGGIVAGVIIQAVSRRSFVKSGKSDEFLKVIRQEQEHLTSRDALSGTEIRALRRLQLLEATILGGVKHSLFSIMHGVTGFDPELNRMMRKAHDPTQSALIRSL